MQLIKLSTGLPATMAEFKRDNPGVIMVEGADLSAFGYGWAQTAAFPDLGPHQTADMAPATEVDGQLVLGWDVREKTSSELIAELPFRDAKTAKVAVLAWIDAFLSPLHEGYSDSEVRSWPVKGPAAINFLEGAASPAELLTLNAEVDALRAFSPGVTIDDVAAGIRSRAEPYLKALAFTSALRQLVYSQIDAVDDLGEIAAILDRAASSAAEKAQELQLPLND